MRLNIGMPPNQLFLFFHTRTERLWREPGGRSLTAATANARRHRWLPGGVSGGSADLAQGCGSCCSSRECHATLPAAALSWRRRLPDLEGGYTLGHGSAQHAAHTVGHARPAEGSCGDCSYAKPPPSCHYRYLVLFTSGSRRRARVSAP